jgi:hypothetical protein
VKCPRCGSITNWDSLQCSCGYDAEWADPATAESAALPPIRPTSLGRIVLKLLLCLVWSVVAIALSAGAMWFLFLLFVGSSIGVNDGANRVPGLILVLTPIAGVLAIAGCCWFIVRRF